MTYLCGGLVLAGSICWLMSQLASIMFLLLHLLIITLTFCPSEPPLMMLYFVQHDRLLSPLLYSDAEITVFVHSDSPQGTFYCEI